MMMIMDSFLSQQVKLCDSVKSSVPSHNWLSGSQTEHTPVPCTTNDSNAVDDAATAVENVTLWIFFFNSSGNNGYSMQFCYYKWFVFSIGPIVLQCENHQQIPLLLYAQLLWEV